MLRILEEISTPAGPVGELIKGIREGDPIGLLSALLPCGTDILQCLTKEASPHAQCDDGNVCNGDEYCEFHLLSESICKPSLYRPDKSHSDLDCRLPDLRPGKCNEEGDCVTACNPGGKWYITGVPSAQFGPSEECIANMADMCGHGISLELSVSANGMVSNFSPNWSFNPQTCTGSISEYGNDRLNGIFTFGESTISGSYGDGDIFANKSCRIDKNSVAPGHEGHENEGWWCTCTWVCFGDKTQ